MTAPIPGTPILVNASGGNGSTTVTIPATVGGNATNGIVAFWSHWDGNGGSSLATLSLDGDSFSIIGQQVEGVTTDEAGEGGAILEDPSTGSGLTVAWAWSAGGARSEGGAIYLVPISGLNVGDAVNDWGIDGDPSDGGVQVQVVVDSETTDLVLAHCQSYVTAVPAISGTVILNNSVVNSEESDISYTSGASPTTTITMTGEYYSSMMAVSLKEATGGGGGGTVYTADLFDSVGLSDTQNRNANIIRTLDDVTVITDLLAAWRAVYVELRDSPGLLDELLAWTARYGHLSETVSIADSVRINAEFYRVLSDNVDVSSQLITTLQAMRTLSDSVDITDFFEAISANGLLSLLSDVIDVSDGLRAVLQMGRELPDNVSVSDGIQSLYVISRTLTEDVHIIDLLITSAMRFALLQESLSINDSLQVSTELLRDVAENVFLFSAMITNTVYSRDLAETVVITDTLSILSTSFLATSTRYLGALEETSSMYLERGSWAMELGRL